MLGIPIEHVIPIAQFLGVAVLGALWVFGGRWGQRAPTPADRTVEIAGALVDGKSVQMLTAAVEAAVVEAAEGRHQARRAIEAIGKLISAIEAQTGEVVELRQEVRQLGDAVARRR